ncbi:36857_t:CDS:2, partial [Gigaspora margarita]
MCSTGCWLKHQRTSDNLYITTAGHCYDDDADPGDAGGSVFSFASPEDLHSVDVH